MTILTPNKKVPDFSAHATSGTQVLLQDYKGEKNIVLYFYPKDSTPGCTIEGRNFRDHKPDFDKTDTVIFGVSRDTLISHEKFKDKQNLNFELISDETEQLCQLFDVIKEKSLFGKKHVGIERSTFLINKEGILVKEWRKVRIKGHIIDVLAAAQDLP